LAGETRVLIADDHEVVRRGLRLFLDHDALVRSLVDQHGGTEVEKEGDSFMLAFAGALAHGGEILVSDLTRALVRDLPRVRFADRGEHELKGLGGRHRLWEVGWRT